MNFCCKCKNADLILIEVVAVVIVFNILHLADVCDGPPFLNEARALLNRALILTIMEFRTDKSRYEWKIGKSYYEI